MSTKPTLKFLGTAIVAAALSTGAFAQTSSTPSATPDSSAPTSNGAMTNNPTDSGAKSHKTMRKHKTEKDHSASTDAKSMRNTPAGEGNNGASNTTKPTTGTGSQ